MNRIVKNAFILTAITLAAGILLGAVYEITKEPIALAKEETKNQAYQAVMQDADTFESCDIEEADLGDTGCHIDEVAAAMTGEKVTGYLITVTTNEGYGGDIQVLVGIAADGTIMGIEMLSISETAGLGMNAKTPEFKGQYAGKKADAFTVTKAEAGSDNEIEAISGATITSKAVTEAVNMALNYFYQVLGGGAGE